MSKLVTIVNPNDYRRFILTPGTSYQRTAQWIADDFAAAVQSGHDPEMLNKLVVVRLPRRLSRDRRWSCNR